MDNREKVAKGEEVKVERRKASQAGKKYEKQPRITTWLEVGQSVSAAAERAELQRCTNIYIKRTVTFVAASKAFV